METRIIDPKKMNKVYCGTIKPYLLLGQKKKFIISAKDKKNLTFQEFISKKINL